MQAISFVLNMKFLQIQKMKQTLPQRIVVLNSSISISIFNFIFIFSSVKFRFSASLPPPDKWEFICEDGILYVIYLT